MLCSEKKFKLKDGRIAVLRSPKEEDAAELLALLKDVTRETDFLLRAPEECAMTEEQETDWVNNARSSPNTAVFLCEVDGEIAGDCEIVFLSRTKLRHRAVVGISLRKVYWNLGIGTAMFEEMIRLAKENITMVIVTHEMGFARQVADRMIFMADGMILEEGTPDQFFENPTNERLKQFLGKIIRK